MAPRDFAAKWPNELNRRVIAHSTVLTWFLGGINVLGINNLNEHNVILWTDSRKPTVSILSCGTAQCYIKVNRRDFLSKFFISKSHVLWILFSNDELMFCLTFWQVTVTLVLIKQRSRTAQQDSLEYKVILGESQKASRSQVKDQLHVLLYANLWLLSTARFRIILCSWVICIYGNILTPWQS